MIKSIEWWSTTKNLQLVDVINVMLNRRMLPLQLWATPMWVQKPNMGPVTTFFRSTLAAMWTRLLKLAKDKIPKEGEDLGFEDGQDAPSKCFSTRIQILVFRIDG